jgi:diguanylate cyclase (GGDEF)-like protein/PAS domain S-box-containing protein
MFKRIGHKLILTFAGISAFGLVILVVFYTDQQQESLYRQNEQMMNRVTQSVIEGLQTVMLAGYADIAQDFAANLQNVDDVVDFRIVRTDGNEAFLDNKTIEDVNRRKKEELFETREDVTEHQILVADDPDFRRAVSTIEIARIYSANDTGEKFLTFIAPIRNQDECHECHGSKQAVRGVVKITTSLLAVEQAVQATREQAYSVAALFMLIIVVFTGLLVKRTIVHPINRVTTAMTNVAQGNLSMSVPVLGRDEISTMAKSFNRMSEKLKTTHDGLEEERDKLTTLILSAHDGMVVTDRHGGIVLMNPSAIEILKQNADDIVLNGFNHLFGDPETMRRAIEEEGYIEIKIDERALQILASTIRNHEGEVIGSAALIRDVTTEKNLQNELRQLSISDALTGLFNRRHLDTCLARELDRSKRYGHEISILMFDVDYFKRFNDDHGHEQGDRILQSIANTVRGVIRKIDIPCRYGGEEFLIILPETSFESAMAVAERIRAAVEADSVDDKRVTISIGVATYPWVMANTHLQFIEAADKALYEAKQAGRNCLRSAQAAV